MLFPIDFITASCRNNYVENCHEAIIPRDLHMRVQEELARRANLKSGEDGNKRLYWLQLSRRHCNRVLSGP